MQNSRESGIFALYGAKGRTWEGVGKREFPVEEGRAKLVGKQWVSQESSPRNKIYSCARAASTSSTSEAEVKIATARRNCFQSSATMSMPNA